MAEQTQYALAIHGGAGAIEQENLPPERAEEVRAGLGAALAAGEAVLRDGGRSLDAVVEAVRVMEDDPGFNAGRGSVLTRDGTVEMDAAVMDGREHRAGALACVRGVRNPARAARAVMERSAHVMLVGEGAERFASEHDVSMAEPDYFVTERRRRELEAVRARSVDAAVLDHDAERTLGTVGAVAVDAAGDLAAATSTGGLTNKHPGRVGDTPVIGAGTYAANGGCAVSATGHGEWLLRWTVARDICARLEYAGMSIDEAVHATLLGGFGATGGEGGVIAVDAGGRVAVDFNTVGMYRAWVRAGESPVIALFAEEVP